MLIITAFSCWMVTYVLDSTSRLSLEKYSVDFVLLKWSAFSVNQILVVTVVVFSELEVKVVASVASSGVVSDVSMFLKSYQNRVKWINVSKLIWFFYIFIYLIFIGLVMMRERKREREFLPQYCSISPGSSVVTLWTSVPFEQASSLSLTYKNTEILFLGFEPAQITLSNIVWKIGRFGKVSMFRRRHTLRIFKVV